MYTFTQRVWSYTFSESDMGRGPGQLARRILDVISDANDQQDALTAREITFAVLGTTPMTVQKTQIVKVHRSLRSLARRRLVVRIGYGGKEGERRRRPDDICWWLYAKGLAAFEQCRALSESPQEREWWEIFLRHMTATARKTTS